MTVHEEVTFGEHNNVLQNFSVNDVSGSSMKHERRYLRTAQFCLVEVVYVLADIGLQEGRVKADIVCCNKIFPATEAGSADKKAVAYAK